MAKRRSNLSINVSEQMVELGYSLLNKILNDLKEIEDDKEVKQEIAKMALEASKPFMPYDTGYLENNSYVDDEGRIIFDTPYAQRLYYGENFNFKTEKHPLACARWLEVGVAIDGAYIMHNTEKLIKDKLKQKGKGGGGSVRL